MNIESHLIRYNTPPVFADLVIDLPYDDYTKHGVKPEWRVAIQNGHFSIAPFARIFCKTDLLEANANWLSKIQIPIHLITGVSDINPLELGCSIDILANKSILSWAGTNLARVNKKIFTIPIGFQEASRGDLVNFSSAFKKKEKILISHHSNTAAFRSQLLESIDLNSSIFHLQKERLSKEDYLALVGKFKYSLCLPGNGLDTHRVYESILMETIPIVLSTPIASMHQQIGAIVVDSVQQINDFFKFQNYINAKIEKKYLYSDFWKKSLQDFQTSLEVIFR